MMHLTYGGKCDLAPRQDQPALRCVNVSFQYPTSKSLVLEGITLDIKPGERVALVGPNGAGKSSLFKLILGMELLNTGQIDVYGHPATHCLHRVAVVPQRSGINWKFPVTVRQVVMMGRYVHLGWFKRPGAKDRDAVDAALAAMEIEHIQHRHVEELSGGQQQRMMLARVLAHDANLLLLDEPLNHVDLRTQELIFHTLERLTNKNGKTVIISTHDLGVLTVHFTRAIFLDNRIIADGHPDDVLTPETIASAYGFEFHEGYKPWTS